MCVCVVNVQNIWTDLVPIWGAGVKLNWFSVAICLQFEGLGYRSYKREAQPGLFTCFLSVRGTERLTFSRVWHRAQLTVCACILAPKPPSSKKKPQFSLRLYPSEPKWHVRSRISLVCGSSCIHNLPSQPPHPTPSPPPHPFLSFPKCQRGNSWCHGSKCKAWETRIKA